MFRHVRIIMVSLSLWLASGVSARATVLLLDNFNLENGGVGALNYNAFANWTVSNGTVDLIGNGFFDFLPGNGLYVDMDGSTFNAGRMTSMAFTLNPGVYSLSFELAGNQRNNSPETVTVQVSMGSLFNENFSLNRTAPFTLFTRTFTVASTTLASLSFEGAGGDNIGMLLDDVEFALVPEPATIALLAVALAATGVRGRKATRNKAHTDKGLSSTAAPRHSLL